MLNVLQMNNDLIDLQNNKITGTSKKKLYNFSSILCVFFFYKQLLS